MRCERLRAAGGADTVAAELRGLVPSPALVRDAVSEIIATVRTGGETVSS